MTSVKKLSVALVLTAAVFGASTPPAFAADSTVTATPTIPTLSIGSSGAVVSHLQSQLKSIGTFTYPTITGYYGAVTAGAVRTFQTSYGINPTGVADSLTQQAVTRAVSMRQVVASSQQYIGVPYTWGGSSPAGFDCSGFVWYLYHQFNRPLDRATSQDYFQMGTSIGQDRLQPGDLIYFNIAGPASHVGIYLGGGRWISATTSKGIWIYTLDNPYWAARYGGARRI